MSFGFIRQGRIGCQGKIAAQKNGATRAFIGGSRVAQIYRIELGLYDEKCVLKVNNCRYCGSFFRKYVESRESFA
jgi:hypothetical protein